MFVPKPSQNCWHFLFYKQIYLENFWIDFPTSLVKSLDSRLILCVENVENNGNISFFKHLLKIEDFYIWRSIEQLIESTHRFHTWWRQRVPLRVPNRLPLAHLIGLSLDFTCFGQHQTSALRLANQMWAPRWINEFVNSQNSQNSNFGARKWYRPTV